MKRAFTSNETLYRGLAMVLILAVLAGCKPKSGAASEGTGTPTSDVLSGKVTITIQDYEFHPDHVKVKAGTTISWINRDPVFHTVVSDTGLFQSTMLAVGQMFSHTFDKPGTYPYYCEKNGGPGGEGMSGVITVVE